MKQDEDKPNMTQQVLAGSCLITAIMSIITFAFVITVVVMFTNHLTR